MARSAGGSQHQWELHVVTHHIALHCLVVWCGILYCIVVGCGVEYSVLCVPWCTVLHRTSTTTGYCSLCVVGRIVFVVSKLCFCFLFFIFYLFCSLFLCFIAFSFKYRMNSILRIRIIFFCRVIPCCAHSEVLLRSPTAYIGTVLGLICRNICI